MGDDTAARAEQNIDDSQLRTTKPRTHATGWPAIAQSLRSGEEEMGAVRTMRTLLDINQTRGFDCMSCAWPDPDPTRRSPAEFCESGAKAVAEEATQRRATPEFFAAHSIAELETWDDFSLGKQGRITHPMLLEEGDTHYRPVTWDRAFEIVREELGKLADPDEAVFYTSGRASNEAAFAYQLFARSFGTNNLPDCSNMCHESTSLGLLQVMGIGKASISLEDLEHAELILIAGQNPGTNAPRMLTRLEHAKQRGGRIVAINPLREAGLLHFDNPQSVKGLLFRGTQLADEYLQIRIGGDQALFQALGKVLIELDEERRGADGGQGCVDRDFVDRHTSGFEAYRDHVARLDWADVERATGLPEQQIRKVAGMIADARSTVICWAMGITQHVHAVATIRDIASVAFLTGNIGKPGAGLCPVRGHSNVQGDRTVGIWEKMPDAFHDRLSAEFGFTSKKEHGLDVVDALKAMRTGGVKAFIGLGGNFTRATPDTERTEASMRELDLTVQISTKPNRSHVVHGRRALILPCLGRTEIDVQATGPQRVSVEDTVSAVHASHGHLHPASPHLRSEVAIVCGIAEAVLAGRPNTAQVDWRALAGDYRLIRRHIEHVVPGFEAYEEKLDRPGGFVLPHPPRDSRTFPTDTGKAKFTVNELEFPEVPEGRLLLQTLRSHDQFNTTIYGQDDRYRGIHNARRVVMMNRKEMLARDLAEGDLVDLVSEGFDGIERRAEGWRVVPYRMPSGNAAAYFPETNVLLPLGHSAKESNSPAAKAVVIRVERAVVAVPA